MLAFFSKLKAAYCHARGLFALCDGRLERAEYLLRECVRTSERFPNPLLATTYLLLSATVEKRGRRAEAVELFWTGMTELPHSDRYSTDDVNYLGTYFSHLLELTESQTRFEQFNITAVAKSLRRDFPMRLSKARFLEIG